MDELSLIDRKGLPDALRVLVETYPRTGWEEHDNFGMLIRFWLDRHVMFRRLIDALRTDTQARLDTRLDPTSYRQRLHRLGGLLVGELQGHHQIEDVHYFPRLSRIGGFNMASTCSIPITTRWTRNSPALPDLPMPRFRVERWARS